ncbi:MAG: ABC transporter substrate-binding protein, partial [Pseudooceanicola nanhaiensis]
EKLGATVTNMAAGEIFQALQSGTLDAAEFVGPYNDLALGFYQVAKNYYFPSFVEPGLATELVVDKAKYQALPDDLQALIKDISQAEYDQVASDFYANDPRALQTLINDHGVNVMQFPEEILQAGAEAAKEIMTGLRESDDPLVKKTAESFIESLNIVRTRSRDTDGAFVQAREKYFTL